MDSGSDDVIRTTRYRDWGGSKMPGASTPAQDEYETNYRDGYTKLIMAKNPDGQEDYFYLKDLGYDAPRKNFEGICFLSSSVYKLQPQFYSLYGYTGTVSLQVSLSVPLCAVRCR